MQGLLNPVTQSFAIGLSGLRLTASQGVALPTTNITDATTLYATPFLFDGIGLPISSTGPWKVISPGEKSVAVPSTNFRLFDVFGYLSGGTLDLEAVNWNQSTYTINAFTAGTQTFTTSAVHGLAIGNFVGITSVVGTVGTSATLGANGRFWQIKTVPTTTSFTVEGSNWAALAYTSGGTLYTIPNTRVTALTTLNGVSVKTGETNKVYLGTGMTNGGGESAASPTTGQLDDSTGFRGLWNNYNRVPRALLFSPGSTSHTYTATTVRFYNNLPSGRLVVVVGVQVEPILLGCTAGFQYITTPGTGTQMARLVIQETLDGSTAWATGGSIVNFVGTANTIRITGTAPIAVPNAGFNFFPLTESVDGGLTGNYDFGRAFGSIAA